MLILGIKPYGHDTSAAIVKDGRIIAGVSEERFNRQKHSREFPIQSIEFCLEQAGITDINMIDEISVCFDYKKLIYHLDLVNFFRYFPVYTKEAWTNGRYQLDKIINTKKIFRKQMGYKGRISFLNHHDCHAASVYYTSSFKDAAILSVDGRGELASTCIYQASGKTIKSRSQVNYPNSLGAFYSCITEYLGFKENEDEGKIMGLAAYGDDSLIGLMKDVLVVSDGAYQLNMNYFDFHKYPAKDVSQKFIEIFGESRTKEVEINQRHMNIARAAQEVLEEAMCELASATKNLVASDNLCMVGGVALNSVANGAIVKQGLFKNIYIYPASGDDGAALGAALYSYYKTAPKKLFLKNNQSPYIGPGVSGDEVIKAFKKSNLNYRKSNNIAKDAAKLVSENKFIGWYQGRAEFGPRSLGNRSIIVDPRKAENKDEVNARIKFRESFRPFAPSILSEHTDEYFVTDGNESPYMILTFDVKKDKQEIIPAVVHVDGTARLQTVNLKSNPVYWNLINEFRKLTGVPVVLNTSFNVMGEPIVNSPDDAVRCFLSCGLDVLIIDNYIVEKNLN